MNETALHTFDDLMQMARQQGRPQRLLVLLLKANSPQSSTDQAAPDQEGLLWPAQARDFPITEKLSLASICEQADEVAGVWHFLMVGVLGSSTGRLPSSDDADAQLKRMAWCVMSGEGLDAYAFFDRDGDAVNLSALPDRGDAELV